MSVYYPLFIRRCLPIILSVEALEPILQRQKRSGDLSGEANGAASEKQVLGQRRLTGVRVRNDGECPPAGGFF